MSATTRTWGLATANARLLTRNRLTLIYGLVLPILPLGFLFAASSGDDEAGASAIGTVLLLAMLFPVYYNVLSLVVTRRDELVLKRLRTGEARDGEILASLALPGVAVAVAVCVAAVPLGIALGQDLPVNLALYVVSVLAGCVMFAAFAVWTAAWTRNAEAAQMTSMPIILLAIIGNLGGLLPERLAEVVERTPGAALDTLVRVSWFGQGPDGDVGLGSSWGAAAEPLAVLALWTVLALWLAQRSMRWEPRA